MILLYFEIICSISSNFRLNIKFLNVSIDFTYNHTLDTRLKHLSNLGIFKANCYKLFVELDLPIITLLIVAYVVPRQKTLIWVNS